ncbi:MAG: flagellar hook-length control protein FliK [Eubacteriales bacterium]
MTGTIGSIGSDLFADATSNLANVQSTYSQNDFSQFMNQSSSDNQNNVDTSQNATRDTKNGTDSTKSTNVDTTKANDKFRKVDKTRRTDVTKDVSGLEGEVATQLNDIKETIASSMGITLDEVNGLMDELGLTDVDLLNVENLSLLLANASGETDVMTLLTDEDLYATFQNLTDMATDVKNSLLAEFGITEDDLTAVLEQMKQLTNESKEVNEIVVGEEVDDESLSTNQGGTQEALISVQQETQTSGEQENSNFSGNSNQESANQTGEDTPIVGVMSQVEQRLDAILANNDEVMETGTSEHILKQLVEYIKINANPTVTELEIQLQPASLGTVNVQVALQDGQLTAQFRAESEIAKEVIESQMVQLRDTLQENGLKIQAIEVTVATHEFERELDQHEPNQEQDEQTNSSKRRVNLNLGDLEDLEEILSEEEQLAVEMMKENGNTVDYTA